MADVKISELPALTSPDGAEELVVNDGGTTKKIAIEDLFAGDNVKAKFGNADDLQIYHDGSNSYVKEIGTGDLVLQGVSAVRMQGGGNNENMVVGEQNGAVTIYHNNSPKLASASTGIDVTGTVTADGLVVAQPSGANILLESTTGGATAGDIFGEIEFKSNDSSSAGIKGKIDSYSEGNVGNGALRFHTGNTTELAERMRIDSSGNVLVGKISTGYNDGIELNNGDYARINRDSGTALYVGRNSTDGEIVSFRKDGATVGSILAKSGDMVLGTGEVGLRFNDGSTNIYPASATTGAAENGTINLGQSNVQFKDLHLSGQVNTGTVVTTGNVLIGTTATPNGTSAYGSGFIAGGEGRHQLHMATDSTNNLFHIRFYNPNGAVGDIRTSGSSTLYNTSSDYRLKTDVLPMTGATATFKQLKPVNFEWIADGTRVDGFLAHELGEVIPAAATGTKDAMMDEEYEVSPATGDVFTAGSEAGFNEVSPAIQASPAYYDIDGVQIKAEVVAVAAVHEAFDAVAEVIHSSDVEQTSELEDGQQWRETTAQVMGTRSVPDMQGIDQAKVVPLLVATVQELLARIEALEA